MLQSISITIGYICLIAILCSGTLFLAAPSRVISVVHASDHNDTAPETIRAKSESISISSTKDLRTEISKANKNNGHVTLILEDGTYQVDNTIAIRADHISLISRSQDPTKVIIQGGTDLHSARAGSLIKVSADHFLLSGITLQYARFHLIQIAGEHNADHPVIKNCILQDSYQQLLKVSVGKKDYAAASDSGLIENCLFRYTAGIGPDFYIGGIDAHRISGWKIRNNTFTDIASPREKAAEHAIHIWRNSGHNIVEGNTIIDCDRGIGFGMGPSDNNPDNPTTYNSGVIRNNTIIHTALDDPYSDAGITLEGSANTLVRNNRIWLGHTYPNAIEYRFPSSFNIEISNNVTNRKITGRNDAHAILRSNKHSSSLDEVAPEFEPVIQ
jgi:hypothetical protein